jgi:hypothetical protein
MSAHRSQTGAALILTLVLSAWICGVWAIWFLGHWPWRFR